MNCLNARYVLSSMDFFFPLVNLVDCACKYSWSRDARALGQATYEPLSLSPFSVATFGGTFVIKLQAREFLL